MKTGNSSFERVEEFKYFGITLKNQNSIQKEIMNRLKSGNACYHSVQNHLSSILQSKNVKIKIHKTIILSVVLYGCETWSLILREKRRPRVIENRVLWRIFGPKKDGVTLLSRTWHCRRMEGAWDGMCEVTRHDMSGERHEHGMTCMKKP
jgi:hypothetical protein